MKKIVLIMAIIVGFIALFVTGVLIFVKTAPQFGSKPSGARLEKIQSSKNYTNGQFRNPIKTSMEMDFGDAMETMREWWFSSEKRTPDGKLPVRFGDGPGELADSSVYVTWYGHSAVLLEMADQRILLDPMLGSYSAPVNLMTRRFAYERPIPIETITDIDVVILSHDHYDHLDYSTIRSIEDHVGTFVTPLGVGSHLESWGISDERIVELDWWESVSVGGITLISTPARHFSGRGFSDRNTTQWASWAILGPKNRVYFSGDGGYGPHFTEIGEKYGPFDFAMIECGQYNEKWKDIHMFPEESVNASLDLRASRMMPIHWGTFKLAPHHWLDPIRQAQYFARQKRVELLHPFIGKKTDVSADDSANWWEEISE